MANSVKWFFGIIVLFGVAAGAYKLGRNSVPAAPDVHQIEEQVKDELISLTKQDFEQYQNLKSLEERYKKADEILGKIVMVFLADLGLKLNFKTTNLSLLEKSCGVPATQPVGAVQAPTISPKTTSLNESNAETPAAATLAPSQFDWTKKEDKLLEIRNEREALEELRRMAIPDLFSTLKDSTGLKGSEAMTIDGRFEGEITFFNRKEHKTNWLIEWEVHLKSASKVSGSSYIALTRKSDGQTFSRSSSDSGPLDNFLRLTASKALIVNVYGDDGFIQIYPLNNNTNRWVGNYYERKKLGTYEFAGQVHLNKVQ